MQVLRGKKWYFVYNAQLAEESPGLGYRKDLEAANTDPTVVHQYEDAEVKPAPWNSVVEGEKVLDSGGQTLMKKGTPWVKVEGLSKKGQDGTVIGYLPLLRQGRYRVGEQNLQRVLIEVTLDVFFFLV